MTSLALYSSDSIGKYVLQYCFDTLKLVQGHYTGFEKIRNYEYIFKGKKTFAHLISPLNGRYCLKHNDIWITILIQDLIVNDTTITSNKENEDFQIIKEVTLSIIENDINILKDFVTHCNETRINFMNKKTNDKITKKFFAKYGWSNITPIPPRNLNTIFLKKNQITNLCKNIENFMNSYTDYLHHGIPYKYNILLHGKPGVGKTSLIHSIATHYKFEILVININSELKESDLLDAFRSINENNEMCLVVIEDIDCIMTDRKNLDSQRNNITMQGLLNCMDGFNNQEGMILILTTNYPEKLDDAIKRSGRIDYNLELTYCNYDQAKDIYNSFFNDKNFNLIWNKIKNYDIPPCDLINFFFFNRKNNIVECIDVLIIKLNKSNTTIYN